jgi:exodeoxyribonuclease V alpha subunit
MDKEETLIGAVDRVTFKNNDNGYHVLSVEQNNGRDKNIVVIITHPNICEGITYEFKGKYTVHQKFGRQFNAVMANEVLPSTKDGLRAYLSSSFFPGIGPAIARRIVDHFGDNVMDVFNNDINQLVKINGISKKKLEIIKDSWQKNKEINEIMMFLREHAISTLYAKKILEFYGKNCVNQILSNPYSLARDISGIGFKIADKIALKVGFPEDGEFRIQACIQYILEQSSTEGHCYLYLNQIIQKSHELLNKNELDELVSEAIEQLISRDDIKSVLVESDVNKRFYSRRIYYNERYCAEKICALLQEEVNTEYDDTIIKDSELSNEQQAAVSAALSNRVSILTGGPGCGKTHTTKMVAKIISESRLRLATCAPTGKAALRIEKQTGHEASTIHRLLGWDQINGGFMHNERNPLPIDFLIVDETSMVDINLMASLLRAVGHGCQILFVGDHNQLSPVGSGAPFKDMIESGLVPVAQLTKIFRQAKGSSIINVAHSINRGDVPGINSPMLEPSLWKSKEDCMFIDSGLLEFNSPRESYPNWSTLRYGKDIVDMIKTLYTDTIKKYKNTNDIQILIPMKITELGTNKLNLVIQDTVNPLKDGDIEIAIGDKRFRKHDKIIHTQNNYQLGGGVFNGEMGRIIDIGIDFCEVKFDDDKIVRYSKGDMLDLELGFCISIHKSQGSEFDCIIIPIMPTYDRMLERSLIYTAITRAKKLCVLIGNRRSLQKAIKTVNSSKRQTSLLEFLKELNIDSVI